MQHRKDFIRSGALALAGAMWLPVVQSIAALPLGAKKKVLVRSGWQTANIGDIAHSFGLLALMEKFLPGVTVVLWPRAYDRGVEQLLRDTFPKVEIVLSDIDENAPALKAAFAGCSFMIHSSGPYINAEKELRTWWVATKKPFGIYGVSLDEIGTDLLDFLGNASFLYCRDTESLKYLKTLGCKCPIQDFAPDAAFGARISNDKKAQTYLDKVGLKKQEFICMIPRMRYTPYWQMKNVEPKENDKERYAISLAFKNRDAEKMRTIITAWVTATDLKVLICPEMTYQVAFGKETLYDPLPEHIKKNCVWRDTFWLPDEASSVYKQARAMVCCEPHSLILAVSNNIPSIHIKQSTDTRKGQMWRDIGLGDWYFLMDETPASQISHQLLQIHRDYPGALRLLEKANKQIASFQNSTMGTIEKVVA